MSGHDEVWIGLADGLWDGTLGPEDLPHWCIDLSTVVTAARGPATPDELAGEADVVAKMQEILRAGPDREADRDAEVEPEPATRDVPRGPKVRRLVAAKIVAFGLVVAIGATAAAATAGVVMPLLDPDNSAPSRVEPSTPTSGTKTGDPAGPGGSGGQPDDDQRFDSRGDGDSGDGGGDDDDDTRSTGSGTGPGDERPADGKKSTSSGPAEDKPSSSAPGTTTTSTTAPPATSSTGGAGLGPPDEPPHGRPHAPDDVDPPAPETPSGHAGQGGPPDDRGRNRKDK